MLVEGGYGPGQAAGQQVASGGAGTVLSPGTPGPWSTAGAGLDEGAIPCPAWCSSELPRKLLLSLTQFKLSLTQTGNSPTEL